MEMRRQNSSTRAHTDAVSAAEFFSSPILLCLCLFIEAFHNTCQSLVVHISIHLSTATAVLIDETHSDIQRN